MENEKYKGDLDRLVSGLRQKEPVLKDPGELTENIMATIRMVPQVAGPSPARQRVMLLKRWLAAASVCLFLVYGYEQFRVVIKIGKLESQNAAIAQNTKYRSALLLNKAIAFTRSDPNFLIRYENIREEKGDELIILKTAILFDVLMLTENNPNPQIQKK